MCTSGQATQIDGKNIQLTSGLSSMDRSARGDDRRSSSSLKTTFIERLETGRVIQHKYIHHSDRHIYQVAVLENIR